MASKIHFHKTSSSVATYTLLLVQKIHLDDMSCRQREKDRMEMQINNQIPDNLKLFKTESCLHCNIPDYEN